MKVCNLTKYVILFIEDAMKKNLCLLCVLPTFFGVSVSLASKGLSSPKYIYCRYFCAKWEIDLEMQGANQAGKMVLLWMF